MQLETITIYCLCADFLAAYDKKDDPQTQMTTEVPSIEMAVARRKNSKRPHPGHIIYLCQVIRKRVETTFSQITCKFARTIHVVTPIGFELKIVFAILACSLFGK